MANKCLQYDGTDDYVQVGNVSDFKWLHGALNTSGFKWTIEFWIKMPNAEPDAIYGLVSTGGASSSKYGIDIFFDDRSSESRSRRLGLMIARGVSGEFVIELISADNVYPNDTNWHYIHVTYDQSLASDNAKIYVDNVLKVQGTKSAYTPSTSDSSYELHIGSLGNEIAGFVGHIDELRISNKVRSEAERTAAYNSGNGTELEADADTVALWHFDEGDGSTTYDETENNHDGTIVGASWDDGFPFIKALAGTIAGVASTSGAVNIRKKIAATCAGVASVSGALIKRKLLQAITNGIATVSGTTRIIKGMAGTSAGVALVQATLKLITFITLTLQVRSRELTLPERSTSLTLKRRS